MKLVAAYPGRRVIARQFEQKVISKVVAIPLQEMVLVAFVLPPHPLHYLVHLFMVEVRFTDYYTLAIYHCSMVEIEDSRT